MPILLCSDIHQHQQIPEHPETFLKPFRLSRKLLGLQIRKMRKYIFEPLKKSFEGILPFSIGDWLCNHHGKDPSHLKASVYLDPAYLSPYLSRHISPPTEYLSDNS